MLYLFVCLGGLFEENIWKVRPIEGPRGMDLAGGVANALAPIVRKASAVSEHCGGREIAIALSATLGATFVLHLSYSLIVMLLDVAYLY